MKIETNNKAENFGHKKFEFRIDAKHQFKAIWALINLYQNKIGTPVQEILSNARDAHREVGKPDHTFKVKVTENEFVCRDFGSGINPEKAELVVCSIGESTKTGDNGQTGGFGLGIKSPLAYVNSFTIESYVDGVAYTYIIAKNGELLEMNLIKTVDTKEVNGTKVIIPIKQETNRIYKNNKYVNVGDSEKFINAVRRTCAFWSTKPTFNHKHAQVDVMELKTVSNGGLYAKNDLFNGNLLVIDGIPYNDDTSGRWNGGNKVMYFNTGDIRLHETRERLADNSEYRALNTSKVDKLKDKIDKDTKDITKYVDKNNLFESFKTLNEYNIGFNYRHKDIQFRNRFITKEEGNFQTYISQKSGRYPYTFKYKKEESNRVQYDSEYFYNDVDDSTQKISRRVKNYINTNYVKNDVLHTVVVLEKNSILCTLMKAKKISSLEIPKIIRTGEKKKSEEIIITILNQYGQDRYYRKLETVSNNYLYLGFKQDINVTEVLNFVKSRGYKICRLSKDTIDQVKDSEHFTDYNEFVANLELTQDEKEHTYDFINTPYDIRVKGDILDEKITELINRNSRYLNHKNSVSIPKCFRSEEVLKEVEKVLANNAEIVKLHEYRLKKYPLIDYNIESNTEYINAVYKYRSENA